jgi:DNA-binding transcriptional MerR regulator
MCGLTEDSSLITIRRTPIRPGFQRAHVSAKAASAAKSRVQRRASAKGDEIVIPDRLYFRIGEVARLCRLPAYVLRFWETEFPQLKPGKSSAGQRMYRRTDVENVARIKRLLYEEGFTIPGARQQLLAERRAGRSQPALPFARSGASSDELRRVRQGLKEVLAMLSARPR